MKDYTKCLSTCEEALKQDKDGKHANEINQQIAKCYNARGQDENVAERIQRAAQDPEIQVRFMKVFIFYFTVKPLYTGRPV